MELIDYWCRIFQTRHHGRKMNWYCYILKLGNLWNMYWLHKPHELKNPSCTFSSLMEKCVTQRKIFKKHFIIFDIGKHAKLALQGPAIFLKNVMHFPSQFSNTNIYLSTLRFNSSMLEWYAFLWKLHSLKVYWQYLTSAYYVLDTIKGAQGGVKKLNKK